jgi:hypothetical protein
VSVVDAPPVTTPSVFRLEAGRLVARLVGIVTTVAKLCVDGADEFP